MSLHDLQDSSCDLLCLSIVNTIMKTMPYPSMMLTDNVVIHDINDHALYLLQTTHQDAVGHHLSKYISNQGFLDLNLYLSSLLDSFTERTPKLEIVLKSHDNTEHPTNLTVLCTLRDRDTSAKFFLIVMLDPTFSSSHEVSLNQLIEASPDALVLVDGNGNIHRVNHQTETLFGYKRSEILGKPVETLIPQRFRSVHPVHRHDYFSSPKVRPMGQGLDLYARKKNGSEFSAEISLSPIDTPDGLFAMAAVRDVTERIELLNASPDAMVVVNEEGNIIRINRQTEQLFGYTAQELIGQKIEMLIPQRYHMIHPRNRSEYYKNPRLRPMGAGLELYALKKDGSEFNAEISLSPVRNNYGGLLVIAAIRNTTLRKQQEQIERQNLLILETNRQNFITNVTHEMRTPLYSIIGVVNLMLDMSSITTEQESLLNEMRRSASTLLNLINNVINYATLSQGTELNIKSFLLYSSLHRHANNFRDAAAVKNLQFINDIQVPQCKAEDQLVYGDLDKIYQIMSALLDNAIKFTHHGHVRVQLIIESETTDHINIRCEVSDTGIGIPKSVQLFKFYGKIDASLSRHQGGPGLGLITSKRLIDLMRGNIFYTSDVNVGSTFWFTLELSKVAPSTAPSPIRSWTPASHRVLVVEDNVTNLKITVKILNKLGYDNVDTALDGLGAFERFKSRYYDLIFMDIQMPIMDGYEATRKIREHERVYRAGSHTVVVALTAHGEETRPIAIDAGMDDFLMKPVFITQLKAIINKWFPTPTLNIHNKES